MELTSRLAAKNPAATIPPKTEPNGINYDLVKEANDLLAAAGYPVTLLEGMRDGSGKKVLQPSDAGWELLATIEDKPEEVNRWEEEDIEQFVESVSVAADLTKREAQIVRFLAEGDLWGPHTGGYQRLARSVRSTPEGVRKAWGRARKKLVDNWASPQLESTRTRKTLRTAQEGDGHRV